MKYLHDHNIIHRDLKPENILLDKYFLPLITDFGLSKLYEVSHSKSETRFGSALPYTAPEIFKETKYSKKTDVYSFSILMFEVLTNSVPYPELKYGKISEYSFMKKVVDENYRPKFLYPVKASLRKLIEQCWSENPDDRPTFDEIFDKLANNVKIEDEKENYILEDVDMVDLDCYIDYITENTDDTKINLDDNGALIYPMEKYIKLTSQCKQLVEKARNDPEAMHQVGVSLINGQNNSPLDIEIGIKYLSESIKNGNIESAIYYSNMLINGELVPRDLS